MFNFHIKAIDSELISDEIVTDEAEEFDFEGELNKTYNIKFASAISTDSDVDEDDYDGVNAQDGRDKEHNIYKVRYEYATAISSSDSRDFCRAMSGSGKVYTKEHIKSMELKSEIFNKGWGPGGSPNTYSIWLYKGGGNCHHYFSRIVYKTSLRNAKANINTKQIISDVKALSEGVTLKRNSGLVAKAPKRMKNNGFLNPR